MRAKCILPFVLIISFVSLLIGGCGFMEKINVLNDSENGDKTEALISANKEFSWDIFKKLNEEDSDKEIFISPLSISSMLTMALNGAEGATRQALIEGLRYDGISIEELNGGYSYLIDRISNIDEKTS